uniref:Mediator of DNA damage checkpoint protein 1 n=1 Tax=Rousettus aegyptiacus TaxID=9407 RepID=A0A7J8KC67_ROUAE|nr:mediator of DNA damage checkpoint 1 [Rousettus aegyptiacus]
MEDTQAISWEVEEEEETERPSESLGRSLEPLGRLHIFSSAHGPEKDFPLYLGKNVVGRMPACSVALPFPSISKQHAVIEILAWDKAPVLRDCGSLNGTQILRPPKVLSPGMSHRLRDQELVLFADLPCQYHRLNVPLPFVSRGPLTVEETPRVQGRTQPQGLLLAEDSEEEVDSLSERCVAKEPRTTSSPVATVVPESDEEGPSLAPDGPGPPFTFNLDSDTDKEENQQRAAGEASSAATRDATAETEQPKAVVTEIQLEKNQCSVKERNNDTKVESDVRNGVVPTGVISERCQPAGEDSETDVDDESRPPGRPVDVHLERAQPFGFIDSDTDLEEEGVPATPAIDPVKRKQVLHGVSTNSPGGPDLAHLQETLADSDTDVEEGEASLMVPLERSQASMVIDSNTDDEEEVSAALTLACLKESRAVVWNRDTDVEELQHSTSMDQPVSSRPTSRATQDRTHRSSVKTPQSIVLTAPELQSSTSKGQSVTTELISGATWGKVHRSFVKTPEPIVPIVPELQPSTPTDQPVTSKPISRGRTRRSSVKTPESIVPTAPEVQLSTSTNQPVTPKPTSRGRTHRFSVKTPEPIIPSAHELQHSTSMDQPNPSRPTSRATRVLRRSSVKTHQLVESTALDLELPNPTDQFVTPKAIAQGAQSRTLRSTTSSVLVSTKLEFQPPTDQPIPPEPFPPGNCSGRARATRKHGPLSVPIVHEPCSAPPEPNSRSSRNQRRGAVRAAKSRRTIPEPAFAQLPEAPTHAPQIQKAEEVGIYKFTPEPQPKVSQNHKRPLGTADLLPLQKRLQRGEVPQKTAFLKEKEDPAERPGKEEDVVITGPGKRKRDQTEEEPEGMPGRSLRRTKLNESTAPKVLFTGVVDARGERTVLALGGSLASSVAEASHLVTDRIRRTVKFLCALGRGIPILSLDWLHQSRKAGCFLPPDEYVVTDPEQENNFGFSLRDALSRAQKRRLLEGYEIHVTPGVQPPPLQMGEIISCCGGTVLSSMPRSYKPQRVVITCSQDFPRCSIPFRVGLPILSPEFLLTGVLKQEAKPEAFVLSTLEMSST